VAALIILRELVYCGAILVALAVLVLLLAILLLVLLVLSPLLQLMSCLLEFDSWSLAVVRPSMTMLLLDRGVLPRDSMGQRRLRR
jgi:hypothetical protein